MKLFSCSELWWVRNYTLDWQCMYRIWEMAEPSGGQGGRPPDLGRSINPISTREGRLSHHITTPPTIFSDLPPSLVVLIPGYVQYDSHNLILLLNYYWKVIFFTNAIMQEIRPCFRQWKLWNQQIIFQERKDCLDAGRTHFHGTSSGWALVSICLCILW